jgi:hypothetical protein
MPNLKNYVRGTAVALVVIPVVFLAVYPVLIVLLPERLVVLADLPQDLIVLLLLDALFVPAAGAVLYWRAKRLATGRGGGTPRDRLDTRDVY